MKKKPLQVIEKLLENATEKLGISSITLSELQNGVEKSRNPKENQKALSEFLVDLEIYSYDDNAAFEYGKVRSFLEKKGTPIGAMDTLIAAHALSLKAKLVSNNIKEFKRVPKLKLENWV
jgi:tRNA(fMet)-specific endonuclease VapC